MKSSSQLFPVQLVSADIHHGIAEDVYRIKPNNSADKSVEIAVTRVAPADLDENAKSQRPPLLLLHGWYQNRRQWLTPDGQGAARWLAQAGFDVWLQEMRGHGLSPLNRQHGRNTLLDLVRYDLPAVHAFVRELNGRAPIWLGHGEGAQGMLTALATGLVRQDEVTALALLAPTQPNQSFWLKWPLLNQLGQWLAARHSVDPVRGPEPEPNLTLRQPIAEMQWFGHWGKQLGRSVNQGLVGWALPSLVAAVTGDEVAPMAECHALSETLNGKFLRVALDAPDAPPHLAMLWEAQAEQRLWQPLIQWLQEHHGLSSAAETA